MCFSDSKNYLQFDTYWKHRTAKQDGGGLVNTLPIRICSCTAAIRSRGGAEEIRSKRNTKAIGDGNMGFGEITLSLLPSTRATRLLSVLMPSNALFSCGSPRKGNRNGGDGRWREKFERVRTAVFMLKYEYIRWVYIRRINVNKTDSHNGKKMSGVIACFCADLGGVERKGLHDQSK